jgi:hypothetical protein
MNWNGKQRNGILGSIAACRETIQATRQRGSAPNGGWLLEKVDPEEHSAALISLVVPFTEWANALPDVEREKWLVWAMTKYPVEVRQWMGYSANWTMMPNAVCKRFKEVVRLGPEGRLPSVYLLPGTPKNTSMVAPIVLETGLEAVGIQLKTCTYIKWHDEWYKVYYPKLPSKTAVSRAIRLYLMGIILGRTVASTNDLTMYELTGIKNWLLYGELTSGIAEHASDTLFHLLLEPGIAEQLPNG